MKWNHGAIDRRTAVKHNRNCDRKLIAASGAVTAAPVCRYAARERSIMTGS
jgi:hypothetical protein